MGITEQCGEVHARMREKGFWDHEYTDVSGMGSYPEISIYNQSIFPEKMMLIVTEVAEMMKAFRDSPAQPSDGEADEAADVLIRLMDYCGARGIDLGAAYVAKMSENAERPRLHSRQR